MQFVDIRMSYPDDLSVAMKAIQDRSEAAMRRLLRDIPDGRYVFEDFVDDDGIDLDRPLRIKVELKVSGDSLTVDLDGSSAQARASASFCCSPMDSTRAG